VPWSQEASKGQGRQEASVVPESPKSVWARSWEASRGGARALETFKVPWSQEASKGSGSQKAGVLPGSQEARKVPGSQEARGPGNLEASEASAREPAKTSKVQGVRKPTTSKPVWPGSREASRGARAPGKWQGAMELGSQQGAR